MFKIRVGLVFLLAFAAAAAAEAGLSMAEIVGSDAIESPAPGVIELVYDTIPDLGRQLPPLRLRWWKKTPISAISGDQNARLTAILVCDILACPAIVDSEAFRG